MMQLSEIATALGETWAGPALRVTGVCTDSREVTPGCLFIALQGEHYDGHHFIADVADQVAAVIVSRDVETAVPCLRVADTEKALWQLAAYWRASLTMPVIGITGSCGKTTTRAMCAALLSELGPTHASIRSYNNHIGVPLTLLAAQKEHAYLVAEIGTDSPGEIAALTGLARPSVGVITLAAPVHLAGFGDLLSIVQEKGAIIRGLPVGGTAVLNADDPHIEHWRAMVPDGVHVMTFGCHHHADLMATDVRVDAQGGMQFMCHYAGTSVRLRLSLLGEHNVMNALAALTAVVAVGGSISTVGKALSTLEGPAHRLQTKLGHGGALIIDDSFNANPVAVSVAIHTLAEMPHTQKILVLGDMLELGQAAPEYHAQVGHAARDAGISTLYAVGEAMTHAVTAFGTGAYHFPSQAELADVLLPRLDKQTVVLIKGSHSMKMVDLVNQCVLTEVVE